MPSGLTNRVIDHLRTAVLLRDGAGIGDGELLDRFLERRDEAALAALVKRHGPMVWGVCRRLLSHHDAEDAFQATFLVFVKKAASIVPRSMVGNWLYGVAHQAALQARRAAARRRAREVQVTVMPDTEAVQQDRWPDMQPLLDQELSGLPDHYRAVLVLCELEGRTRKEVARQLGVPEGTVAGRLARARALLAKRLTARGVTLSAGALAAALGHNAALPGVPDAVVSGAIRAASFVAARQAAAAGPVSVKAAALTEEVLRAMLMNKLKVIVAVVLVLGFLMTGATALCRRTAEARDNPPVAEEWGETRRQPEWERDGFTAWGKEVDGVQAGVGYLPGRGRAYRTGETVRLVVRVRNLGKKEVKLSYVPAFFYENPPAVTDGEGKPVRLERLATSNLYGYGFRPLLRKTLAPGKQVDLCELNLALRPASEREKNEPWALYGTGKFQLRFESVAGGNADPVLSKLDTGKLGLDVKDAETRQEKREEDGLTAWGKEAGGLQAGLAYRPGQKRAYAHGETVTLVVRVRNVGKEAVNFQFLRKYFIEQPPVVTDAQGKPLHRDSLTALGFHVPEDVKLAPGKEIELYELKLKLRPPLEGGHERIDFERLCGTGKFQVQYERVFGNTSAGSITIDPTLSKLGTGKLELEVKPDAPADTGKK
jgi:RNA polymerase sigma factor (sigma-70 family)